MFVVIDANHGDFVGHLDSGSKTGVEDMQSAIIVARHDTDRFWKPLEPLRQATLPLFPASRSAVSRQVNLAGIAGGFDELDERVGAGVEEAIFAARRGAEGELAEPNIEELAKNQLRDGEIVGADARQAHSGNGVANIDGGQMRAEDGPRHAAVVDANEDALATPLSEPRRRRGVETLRAEENGPGAAFVNVACDSTQESASVGERSLDQKGDVRRSSHGCRHDRIFRLEFDQISTIQYTPSAGEVETSLTKKRNRIPQNRIAWRVIDRLGLRCKATRRKHATLFIDTDAADAAIYLETEV